jgi:hypothetical protein
VSFFQERLLLGKLQASGRTPLRELEVLRENSSFLWEDSSLENRNSSKEEFSWRTSSSPRRSSPRRSSLRRSSPSSPGGLFLGELEVIREDCSLESLKFSGRTPPRRT